MNVLLIGGSNSLMQELIRKMNKEGHRVSVLTGSRYKQEWYPRVFERYDFTYDNAELSDVFESADPDVTVFLGAYDTNFNWHDDEINSKNSQTQSVRFVSGVMNLLMAYSMRQKGRFIYLSGEHVFGGDREGFYTEDEMTVPEDEFGMALAQAEELCASYRTNRGLDVVVLRVQGYYFVPRTLEQADTPDFPVAQMCLQAMADSHIVYNDRHVSSYIHESDVIQFISVMIGTKEHKESVYHISTAQPVSQKELAGIVKEVFEELRKEKKYAKYFDEKHNLNQKSEVSITAGHGLLPYDVVLSNKRFDEEFGINRLSLLRDGVKQVALHMIRHPEVFLQGMEEKKSLGRRMLERGGWILKASLPFIENMIAFIPFFMLNNRATDSRFFSKLDFYLLYVLLFAIVHGQQQATFSAVLATAGYMFRQMYGRTGFEVLLDYNTYVWIAQLFILGLIVGYMKDRISAQKEEATEDHSYMAGQIDDIKDINSSNVRVKDALQTQIINQNDSVGKIYEITSSLNRYSSDEVLFYATEILQRIIGSDEVAIYTVSNRSYARLFTATSKNAQQLGNSIKYVDLGELYDAISNQRVYINRKLDPSLPMMASAIYERDEMQMIILIWKLPWEKMTLGQANLLAVTGSLIQNSVVRANRYLEALRSERFVENTRILNEEAYTALISAYRNAEVRGLTSFKLLKIIPQNNEDLVQISEKISGKLRPTDYVGLLEDGYVHILLTNSDEKGAQIVKDRMEEVGFLCEVA